MDKEQFVSILKEEGLDDEQANRIWDEKPADIDINTITPATARAAAAHVVPIADEINRKYGKGKYTRGEVNET